GRPVHHLVGFRSVNLDAGTSERVVVECSIRPVQRWTGDGFAPPTGDVIIRAGSYAGDPAAVDEVLAR
ncbi:MAG: fibronectin type III-like domain-contianing protein, partial [Mycobacterium sp.]|nr:fibronectin type III-like domain-contianing protein [Mycobacterium sp.]